MNVICNCVLISDRFNVCGISAEEEIFCSINEINCFRGIHRLFDSVCNLNKTSDSENSAQNALISTHSLCRAL